MHITHYPPDGSPVSHATGAWEFGYALDGRAVIDVWQVPGCDTLAGVPRAADQECGLCVRIWARVCNCGASPSTAPSTASAH